MDKIKTPPIPDWVREIAHPQYRNIFSFNLGNTNLWGTETLLGDWNGQYLLVAKDFYPSKYIEEQVQKGEKNPYRYNPAAPTNRNLLKTLKHFRRLADRHDPATCGFMYISACFLLRADGVIRGALPDLEAVMRLSAPVVKFTIDNMPNLRTVVLMGRDADSAFRVGGGLEEAARRGYRVHRVSHPANAMTDQVRFEEWTSVFG